MALLEDGVLIGTITNDEFVLSMPTDEAGWARLFFQIAPESWVELSETEKQAYIAQMPVKMSQAAVRLEHLETQLYAYMDEPDVQERIDWIREDIRSIWDELWDSKENIDIKIEGINKRIDDMLIIFSGVRKLQSYKKPNTQTGEKMKGFLIKASEPMKWQKTGDVLKITGTLIAEGTWTGIDGQTVFYPRSIFAAAASGIVNQSIKRGHNNGEDDVIGFVTAASAIDNRIDIEGIVYNIDAISDVALGTLGGISMEADVQAEFSDTVHSWVATSMELLKATLVESPACEPCKVGTICSVALEKAPETNTGSKTVKKDLKMSGELTLLETPLFKDVVAALQGASVDDSVTMKVLEILRKSVKAQVNTELEAEVEKLKGQLGKANEATEAEAEKVTELEAEKVTLLASHTTALGVKDAEILAMDTIINDGKKAEISATLAKIKVLDKDFDEKDLVEGVDSLDAQKAMLSKFYTTLAKRTGTIIQVGDASQIEGKVQAMLSEMGIDNVKNFVEGTN